MAAAETHQDPDQRDTIVAAAEAAVAADDRVTLDFDALWAEADRHAPTVRVHGETITLPATLPAAYVLMVDRLEREAADPAGDPAVTIGMLYDVLATVYGRARVRRWQSEHPTGVDRLMQLVIRTAGLYMGDGSMAEVKERLAAEVAEMLPPEVASPPNRAARRAATRKTTSGGSSGTGRSSKLTSGGSTGSGSTGRRSNR